MCGIFAYIGKPKSIKLALGWLQTLEYRGYDSCGVCFKTKKGLKIIKTVGGVDNLTKQLRTLNGVVSNRIIAHTRWATHGKVSTLNAHPHTSCNNEVAVVHNGIIENFNKIKSKLRNHKFTSQTDTELIAHLVEDEIKKNKSAKDIIKYLYNLIEGSYAIVIFLDSRDEIILLRKDCPLVVGLNNSEIYICSDSQAISNFVNRIIYLHNNTGAIIKENQIRFVNSLGLPVSVQEEAVQKHVENSGNKKYKHHMLHEIFEQENLIYTAINHRLKDLKNDGIIDFSRCSHDALSNVKRIVIFGCGTTYHACLYGSYLMRELLGIHTEAWIASELRYSKYIHSPNTLYIGISQSGETLDTLQIVWSLKERGEKVLGITNSPSSQLAKESDYVILMKAGREIGVAATKTYTAQLLELMFFTMMLAQKQKINTKFYIRPLEKLPAAVSNILKRHDEIRDLAEKFYRHKNYMFIGRKFNVPTAYEGALKLKEITYLHAEGYAGGEMKHGPIALVDKELITFAVAPEDPIFSKIESNISEIKSRGGKIICITTSKQLNTDEMFLIPTNHEFFYPLLCIIPLHLFAYHVADLLGREIDKPRNLAKSVTVE
ncbi:MAG: glutamine--fructose-6-phosphate transaminase (isomerizing) [Planctomycetes bacterium]|nr:glutamine--fructose-6-phosphate transaminase (isomerizing) [Planctomycetota bacterium]